MPVKNTFVPYDLSSSNKKLLNISLFKGVDYNKAQLQVANYHAVDILNIVYRDRVNQKRNGWEQLAKVNPIIYHIKNEDGTYTQKTNSTNINGVWELNGRVIAHIGKLICEIKNINDFLRCEIIPLLENIIVGGSIYKVGKELEDYKSFSFINEKTLYILGGNKYYSLRDNNGSLQLEEVEDNPNTYIPTTTIGITYADSKVSRRTALDDVNLLSQFRKNKLVSGTYFDDGISLRTTRFWEYALDTNIVSKKPTDINNIVIKISSLKGAN